MSGRLNIHVLMYMYIWVRTGLPTPGPIDIIIPCLPDACKSLAGSEHCCCEPSSPHRHNVVAAVHLGWVEISILESLSVKVSGPLPEEGGDACTGLGAAGVCSR